MKILVAMTNLGKFKELREMLGGDIVWVDSNNTRISKILKKILKDCGFEKQICTNSLR